MADKKGEYIPPPNPVLPNQYPQQQPAGAYMMQYPTPQYPAPQYPVQYGYTQPQVAHPMSQPMASAPPPYQAYGSVPQQGPPPPYTQYPQQTQMAQQPQVMMAHNAYDAGARFDGIAQPRIPPPPPGVTPNAAQLAALQGHTVVGTQQKSDWFSGGSGGGYTWW